MYTQPSRHTFEVETAALQGDAIELGKLEALKLASPLEPGKTRLFAALDTTKEALKRFIEPHQSASLDSAWVDAPSITRLANFGEAAHLFVQRNAFASLPVGVPSLLERTVIQVALLIEDALECGVLTIVRKQPILERQTERGYIGISQGEAHTLVTVRGGKRVSSTLPFRCYDSNAL